jgi:hypothetical protein
MQDSDEGDAERIDTGALSANAVREFVMDKTLTFQFQCVS